MLTTKGVSSVKAKQTRTPQSKERRAFNTAGRPRRLLFALAAARRAGGGVGVVLRLGICGQAGLAGGGAAAR